VRKRAVKDEMGKREIELSQNTVQRRAFVNTVMGV
jgi:hypothetical protein